MSTEARPKPVLRPEYCKACGRCIDACARKCIECGTEIEPASGFVPVALHLEEEAVGAEDVAIRGHRLASAVDVAVGDAARRLALQAAR